MLNLIIDEDTVWMTKFCYPRRANGTPAAKFCLARRRVVLLASVVWFAAVVLLPAV
jgi:hypothetical protein